MLTVHWLMWLTVCGPTPVPNLEPPPMPALPTGLPEARTDETGTWIPAPADNELRAWILYAKRYPDTVVRPLVHHELAIASTQWELDKVDLETEIKRLEFELEKQKANKLSGWQIATLVGIGSVIGLVPCAVIVWDLVYDRNG